MSHIIIRFQSKIIATNRNKEDEVSPRFSHVDLPAEAVKLSCPATCHGGTCSYLHLGTRWRWVVSITPRPRFTPGERIPGTNCTRGWVGPRAGLDAETRRKILCPCRGSNPGHPVRSQSLYCLSYPGSEQRLNSAIKHCAWANVKLRRNCTFEVTFLPVILLNWNHRNENRGSLVMSLQLLESSHLCSALCAYKLYTYLQDSLLTWRFRNAFGDVIGLHGIWSQDYMSWNNCLIQGTGVRSHGVREMLVVSWVYYLTVENLYNLRCDRIA
jgi:hypothetical protein